MKKLNLRGKKLSEKGKKAIVLTMMVALLVTVGVLQVNLSGVNDADTPVVNGSSVSVFFNSHRANRTQARQEEISILDSIIASGTASSEMVQDANAKKMAICDMIEKELSLETLIKGKGFEEVAVIMSDNVLNILVTASGEVLTNDELAKIYNVVLTKTNYDLDNVIITPY